MARFTGARLGLVQGEFAIEFQSKIEPCFSLDVDYS